MAASATIGVTLRQARDDRRRILAVACGVHALHDGFTDLIYVLLPVWQAEFGLSFAALGVLRMLFAGAMAGLQMPASWLAVRWGGPLVLAIGTVLAGGAYVTIGLTSAGFVLLVVVLLIGGAGAATQHPIGSSLVATAYEAQGSRGPLGTYNFAGDLGKMAIPATTAWLMAVAHLAQFGGHHRGDRPGGCRRDPDPAAAECPDLVAVCRRAGYGPRGYDYDAASTRSVSSAARDRRAG